jgi:hypothetical protein
MLVVNAVPVRQLVAVALMALVHQHSPASCNVLVTIQVSGPHETWTRMRDAALMLDEACNSKGGRRIALESDIDDALPELHHWPGRHADADSRRAVRHSPRSRCEAGELLATLCTFLCMVRLQACCDHAYSPFMYRLSKFRCKHCKMCLFLLCLLIV